MRVLRYGGRVLMPYAQRKGEVTGNATFAASIRYKGTGSPWDNAFLACRAPFFRFSGVHDLTTAAQRQLSAPRAEDAAAQRLLRQHRHMAAEYRRAEQHLGPAACGPCGGLLQHGLLCSPQGPRLPDGPHLPQHCSIPLLPLPPLLNATPCRRS